MKNTFFIALSVFGCIVLMTSIQSCYYDNEETLYGTTLTTTCTDSTVGKFATNVLPIMTAQCATSGCHDAATATSGANLSAYASIKSYITSNKDRFLGSMKHTVGYSQMPKSGSQVAKCDVAKIESWINAGMLNN